MEKASHRVRRAKQVRRVDTAACLNCPVCNQPLSIADAKKAGERFCFDCTNCKTKFTVRSEDVMSDYARAMRA